MKGYQVVGKNGFGQSHIIWPTREEAEAHIKYLTQFKPEEQWVIISVNIREVSNN